MSLITENNLPGPLGISWRRSHPAQRNTWLCPPTTAGERGLLVAAIALFPLEGMIPVLGGFSSSFILFVMLAGYCLIYRPATMIKTARHPVFLASYLFLMVGVLIESLHSHQDYSELVRIALMVGGAIFWRPCAAIRRRCAPA